MNHRPHFTAVVSLAVRQMTPAPVGRVIRNMVVWLHALPCAAVASLSHALLHRWTVVSTVAHSVTGSVLRPITRRIGSMSVVLAVTNLSRSLSRRLTAERGVALLASALSVGFYVWYANQGLIFAYSDAVSHMMIARWVYTSRTPGLAQLGTVWLPLHHALMLPFVWNDPLWRSGFAGAFPSMVAFVVGSVYMFRVGKLCFTSAAAGFVAALAFMLNPNMLYMQSTAMSELDLLCAGVIAVYYLLRWTYVDRAADLVKCGAAIAAGTLIRYDGWALAAASAVIVAYVAWRKRGRVGAEARSILFGTFAFAGCIGWVVYNWVIFHDPLAFYRGLYSTRAQQQRMETTTVLATHHNLWLSMLTYSQSVIDTVGWPIACLALLALAAYVYQFRLRPTVLPMYALLAPLAFNWLALFTGSTVLYTPEFMSGSPHFYFNERYGMVVIPAAALLLAYWAAKHRALLVCTLGIVVILGGLNPALGTPYALQDPINGVTSQGRTLPPQEGQWLASAYQGGNVLIAGGPFEAAIFYSGLPGHAFITDGNGAEFQAALAHPETSVTWIVMNPNGGNYDPVWVSLHQRQDWRAYFVLRTTIGTAQFYERIGSDTK